MEVESTWLAVGLVVSVALTILAYRVVIAIARNARWVDKCFEAWIQQNFDEARVHLEVALNTAEEFGSKDIRLALSLFDLGNMYRSVNRDDDANSLAVRAETIFKNLWPSVTVFARPGINAMARLYRKQFEYRSLSDNQVYRPDVIESLECAARFASTNAREVYLRALAVREKALGTEHLLVADSLENLAASAYHDKISSPGQLPLERALKIREMVQGPDHTDVGNTIETQVYQDYVEPVSDYQRVLMIRENAWGPEHPDLVPTLKNLGLIHQSQNTFDEAASLFERALAIHENQIGHKHLEIVEDLYALADVYRAQNKANEAEALLKRALEIREEVLGPRHPEVADSLDVLAWLYDTREDFGKVEPLLKRSLKIRESSFDIQSHEVAQSLEELAGLFIVRGHAFDAKPLLERALVIRMKIGDIEPPTVADRHIERWFDLFGLDPNWHHDAEPLLKRALAIREVAFGKDHMRVAETLKDYEILLRNTGRDQEADEICAKFS